MEKRNKMKLNKEKLKEKGKKGMHKNKCVRLSRVTLSKGRKTRVLVEELLCFLDSS